MEGPDVSGVKASNEATNLDWDSDYWTKGPLSATAVYIMPTISTGDGTRRLLATTSAAVKFHQAVIDHLKIRVYESERNRVQHALNLLFYHVQLQKHSRVMSDNDIHQQEEPPPDASQSFSEQHEAARQLLEEGDSVYKKFVQISKIADRVLADQQEQGEGLLKSKEGVQKLMIATKCLDLVWADVQVHWRALKAAVEDFEGRARFLLGPDRGQTLAELAAMMDGQNTEDIMDRGSQEANTAPYAEIDWDDKTSRTEETLEETKSRQSRAIVDSLADALGTALGVSQPSS